MDAGLIGIGSMGRGIALSLLRGGHRLTVYNRTAERAQRLAADGALVAASIHEACQAGVVLTILADDAAVEGVVSQEGGILASLPPGGLHVSLSTISVALSERLATIHHAAGQEYVAAPVFGRPDAAEASRLAIVAAGSAAAVERARPLFEALGPTLKVIDGRPSLANVVKLCGNFLLASVIESLAEAFALARTSGVEPAELLDFLTGTMFPAPVYRGYGGLMVESRYEPAGFAARLGAKDVSLVLQAAERAGAQMPVANLVHGRLVRAIDRGYGEQDWAVLGRLAAEDAGLES
jgi:3-hydroxyisobutyrate dehydrogenase-like beta-hydroxyacid dehydrogenase